jgi:predicted PurR-regulated permease PerM
MWDEDPGMYRGFGRFLFVVLTFGLVTSFLTAWLTSYWQPFLYVLELLGAALAALCAYIVIVWMIAYLGLKLWESLNKLRQKLNQGRNQ